MLSESTINTVKSTAPLIAEKGPIITETFYARMFEQNPELLNIFNMANQRKGTQAQALFNAVCAYANNIDNIEVLVPAVTHIAHKHTSLSIKPEHYGIVGGHLLATIQDTFELPDDHEILSAWAEAYQILADIFINAEEGIYAANDEGDEGWRDFKPFIIDKIVEESPFVKSFYLKPADGKKVKAYQGGQYLSVKVKPENHDYEEIRQYSLSTFGQDDYYRISTKREEQGVVTQYMHQLNEGDQVEVHTPAGVFTLNHEASANTFISGGVGITALASMFKELEHKQSDKPVQFIQCVQDKANELLAEEITSSSLNPDYKLVLGKGSEGDAEGFITAELLAQWLTNKEGDFYLCGPLPFMKAAYSALLAVGVAEANIHYEVFGPNASLND